MPDLSEQQERVGTEIEGERSDWGGSVSVWERKRRGVDREREREREQSDPSCDEDTQEECIPQAESIRKAAKQPRRAYDII